MKERKRDKKEANLQEAISLYKHSKKLSIHLTAEKFAISSSTLQNHPSGTETWVQGHVKLQVLTAYEEKAIVRWCERLDEWAHPPQLAMVKSMAQGLLHKRIGPGGQSLGKNWLTRFLNRHSVLASRFGTRLDRQRALASSPDIIRDFFKKVF